MHIANFFVFKSVNATFPEPVVLCDDTKIETIKERTPKLLSRCLRSESIIVTAPRKNFNLGGTYVDIPKIQYPYIIVMKLSCLKSIFKTSCLLVRRGTWKMLNWELLLGVMMVPQSHTICTYIVNVISRYNMWNVWAISTMKICDFESCFLENKSIKHGFEYFVRSCAITVLLARVGKHINVRLADLQQCLETCKWIDFCFHVRNWNLILL